MKLRQQAKRRGRPRTLTMAKVEAIGKWIALGMTEEQACIGEGVKFKTFESAKRRNEEFAGAIKRAQVEFLKRALVAIADGGESVQVLRDGKLETRFRPWQSLAWILERRHKGQFSRTETQSLPPELDGTILTQQQIDVLTRIAHDLYVPKPQPNKERKHD